MCWCADGLGKLEGKMMDKDYFRGHEVVFNKDKSKMFYKDVVDGMVKNERELPYCGHCGKEPTDEGHDACLGTLPGLMNACCGHGGKNSWSAYVQFMDGSTVQGEDAIVIQEILKKNKA